MVTLPQTVVTCKQSFPFFTLLAVSTPISCQRKFQLL